MQANRIPTIVRCSLVAALAIAAPDLGLAQRYQQARQPGELVPQFAKPISASTAEPHRQRDYANYQLDLAPLVEANRKSSETDQENPPGRRAIYDAQVAPATYIGTDQEFAPATRPESFTEPRSVKATLNHARESRLPDADALVYREPAPPEPLKLGAMVSRLVIGTATVLGACVLSLVMAKRWMPSAGKPKGSTAKLRVIASLNLPNKSYLQLVEVDERRVIVAGNAAGVQSVVPLVEAFQDGWEPDGEELLDRPEGTLKDVSVARPQAAALRFFSGVED